jgi:hypothetical protein
VIDEQMARVARFGKVRNGFAIAAVVLPLGIVALAERQARRIDELATKGEVVEAFVTEVSRDGRLTRYAYEAGGKRLAGAVEREAVQLDRGQVFPILVSPVDPTLSRATTDRDRVAQEAARSRRFAPKLAGGLAAVLGLFTLLAHRDLARARRGASFAAPSPREMARRMRVAFAILLVLAGGVAAWHARDALARGQSLVPVALALVLSIAALGGTFAAVRGGDAASVRARAANVLRWAVPLLVVLTLLRVLLTVLGQR